MHGPPGTGKTTTLVAGVCEFALVHKGAYILITAPSNVAVENLQKKLTDDDCQNMGVLSCTSTQ